MMASNAAIKDYASLLRRGSHLVVVSAKHELLMERMRAARVLSGARRFRAGHTVSLGGGLLKAEYQQNIGIRTAGNNVIRTRQ